jgi:predicted ATPase
LQEFTALTEAELLQHVKDLLGAQLVVEVSAEEYAFRHALTREAVYATLLKRERKALHRTVAEILERRYGQPNRLEAHLGDLAYHFHEAGAWEQALEYSRRAGERPGVPCAPRSDWPLRTRSLRSAAAAGQQT